MSYPDPTPPNQFISSLPFTGGDGFWPPYMMENQSNQQPDLSSSQFDRHYAFKRPKVSETPSTFPQFEPMNPRTYPPNVPGGRGTTHIFFKTRICAKFMEGTCRNGDQCTFAHGHDDLREPPPNWQELIREKDRGSGSGNWGDDQRMIHRMKICKKFYNGEECPYGAKCNFLHERPMPPPMKKFKADMPGEQRESSAISIGVTGDARGSGTDFDQTSFWKTKMCSKWEMGQCPFGERCHFAHGRSELRFTSTPDEVQVVIDTSSAPRKSFSVPVRNNYDPASLAICDPPSGDEDLTKASKWKINKKINRIYGDWLDDLPRPYNSPSNELI